MEYLNDTDPEIEKIQISLIQKASITKRFKQMQSLTKTTINLSRRAILRANPNYTKQELDIAFIRLHHSDELANRLNKYLNRKTT
jgi:hypothetical protein